MLIALLFACAGAAPQENKPAGALPSVTVTATRDPVEKSYRKMISGMDLFERLHGTAPNATLRFKLLPRRPNTDVDHIVLEVVGTTFSYRVPVAPDHTFTLERNGKALDEDAAWNESAERCRAPMRRPTEANEKRPGQSQIMPLRSKPV